MDSYIDKYNKEVEEKCKEIMMNKKNIIRRDILAPNKIFNSNMGGFVSQPNLTKNQFINIIKNGYVNLGEKTPSVSQLEDLYIKSFNNFSFEEFAEFMDLVQFGNFQTIEEAYKSFIIDLKNRDDIMGSSLDNPLYPNNRFSQIQEDYDEEDEDKKKVGDKKIKREIKRKTLKKAADAIIPDFTSRFRDEKEDVNKANDEKDVDEKRFY